MLLFLMWLISASRIQLADFVRFIYFYIIIIIIIMVIVFILSEKSTFTISATVIVIDITAGICK